MAQTPFDFLNLFVRPPGNLIYFLAVVALSLTSLFMALGERWRQPERRDTGRYLLASLGLVIAWLLLMFGALVAVVTRQDSASILPPLERAANAIALLLVGWAFTTADHDRWGRLPNILLLLLMGLLIAGYVLTGTEWAGRVASENFNLSQFGLAWTFIPFILSILGALLVLAYFRLITDAPLKLVFFAVLALGYGGTLYQITQGSLIGHDAGLSRLAFLAALPILPAIIYRLVISHLQSEVVYQTGTYVAPVAPPAPPEGGLLPPLPAASSIMPIQRDSIQLLKTLGLILEEANPTSIPLRVVTSALDVLKAEVGALLTLQDANYADVVAAYDQMKERQIAGMALNLDDQPTLVNAVERRLQRPLYPDRNVEELRDLFNRLDVDEVGPTYFQPLMSGKQMVGVLLVGLPYSKRELDEPERELLKGIGILAGNLLALSFAARDARLKAEERAIQALVQGVPLDAVKEESVLAARQEMQASLQLSREQISELSRQVTQLKIELDAERSRVASLLGDTQDGLSISQRILALNEEQQKLREERDRLAARLQEAQTTLAGAMSADNEMALKTMIEVLSREKDELQMQRESLQAQLAELRSSSPRTATPQMVREVLERLSQDKARLELERDQFRHKLVDIEAQLKALGVENGTAGLAQLIGQLTEQRAILQAKLDSLTLERDALLSERARLEESIRQAKERDSRIEALQNEIRYLASDREALIKARDQIRAERDDLLAKQEALKQQRARLLAEASGYQIELAEAHQEQAKLRVQLQQVADERSDASNQRDRLLAEKQALETERNQLLARWEGDRDRLAQVGENGVGSLTRLIEEVTAQRNELEHELNETRTQLALVQNQLDALQVRMNAQPDSAPGGSYNPDLVLGMVQELRTPLTSIIGYLDLLLEESAGILGEMQRKFIQRVAANVSRMTFMLEDITHVAALDTNRLSLVPEAVDVVGLLEDAISSLAHQFREKGLTVHLNLDDSVPNIRADRDAVTQVINQLLTNAYLASPPNSPVLISAHRQEVQLSQNENLSIPTDCLLISVEDRGGGIAPEDVPRVFARKYKAANPLIEGVGDTGVGLSIAKTLAEAHNGGLWLETRPTVGTVFYFALPIDTSLEAAKALLEAEG